MPDRHGAGNMVVGKPAGARGERLHRRVGRVVARKVVAALPHPGLVLRRVEGAASGAQIALKPSDAPDPTVLGGIWPITLPVISMKGMSGIRVDDYLDVLVMLL